ncbi:MAG: site-2 protease family protein [Eubacteriales bacterium]
MELVLRLLMIPSVLIALTVHEVSHGYAAYRLGDPTARSLGRLSLNPLRHLDIVGTLCMLFLGFGWAKPVPINPRNFKNPRVDMAKTAFAGPLSNILLAFFSIPFYLLLLSLVPQLRGAGVVGLFAEYFGLFLFYFQLLNLSLALFNLLPVPPFDGSRIFYLLLPKKWHYRILRHERGLYFFMLAWLLLGNFVRDFLRVIPVIAHTPFLYTAAGFFSLTGWLTGAVEIISRWMTAFWQLILFFLP